MGGCLGGRRSLAGMSADDVDFTLEMKFVQACIKLLGRNPEVRHLSAVSLEVPGVKHRCKKGSNAWARHCSLVLMAAEPQKEVCRCAGGLQPPVKEV